MTKINQSPKLPAEKRRRQLLNAATRLFVRKGYRGTTTEEIARAARLTKGALYHHFKSKEDILFALVSDALTKFEQDIAPLATRTFTPVEFVRVVLGAQGRDNYAEYRTLMDIWVQAMRFPRIRKFLVSYHEDAQAFFADHLDPAFGRDRRARMQIAILTFAFVDGLATRLALQPKSLDVEAQVELFARVLDTERRQVRGGQSRVRKDIQAI